ncbi:AraC family transcriptional regulator [Porphyrobacter sp. TH134]|uniref:AraC family transcriptional regulator n=1 Tax=Porphyrobacter sp. TH134 TaxID=2067450 RepID=UPI0015526665|nr:AraC family transcriptional regulator [Porphyrobacter sp. TH134]
MRSLPKIGSSVLRSMMLPLAEQNCDPGQLIADCGIARALVDDPEGRVPLENYLKLLNLAAERAGDPLLGIRLARAAGPETLGAIGFLFLSSATLADAMRNLVHFLDLLQDVTRVRFEHDRDEISFVYDIDSMGGQETRQDVEFSLALTSRLIRMYGGDQVEFRGINFRHSALRPYSDYKHLLNAPVFFEQSHHAVTIAAASGAIRGSVLHPGLADILSRFLEERHFAQHADESFESRVKAALFESRTMRPRSAASLARQLGVSTPTLFRRLRAEGSGLRAIIDQRQFGMATEYLRSSKLSIAQVAEILGYSESASFTRAFARWSGGVTPAAWRKAQRARTP